MLTLNARCIFNVSHEILVWFCLKYCNWYTINPYFRPNNYFWKWLLSWVDYDITVTSNSESLSFKIAPYSEAYRFVKSLQILGNNLERKSIIVFIKTFLSVFHCYYIFQKTVCGTMTECSSVRTTKTMIMQYIIVDQNGTAGGGIAHVTGQILTGITGTQIMAKG